MDEIQLGSTYLYGTHDWRHIPINTAKFSIGRGIGNSLVLEDFNISKEHCVIMKSKEQIWYIVDYSSKHVVLNNKKIRKKAPKALSNGDIIKLSNEIEYIFTNIPNQNVQGFGGTSAFTPSTDGCTTGSTSWECEQTQVSESDSKNSDESDTSEDEYYGLVPKKRKIDNEDNNSLPEYLEDELHCIICAEYVIEACELTCSHTFCRFCINNWKKLNNKCPVCSEDIIDIVPNARFDRFVAEILSSSLKDTKDQYEEILKMRNRQGNTSNLFQHENKTINEISEDLQCAICTELFINPIVLNCSHVFCKYCLQQWLKMNSHCPICRQELRSAIKGTTLDNIISKIIENSSDDIKSDRNIALENRRKLIESTVFANRKSKTRSTLKLIYEVNETYEWERFLRLSSVILHCIKEEAKLLFTVRTKTFKIQFFLASVVSSTSFASLTRSGF